MTTTAHQIDATEARARRVFDHAANGTRALRLANASIEHCMFARHADGRGDEAEAVQQLQIAEDALHDIDEAPELDLPA